MRSYRSRLYSSLRSIDSMTFVRLTSSFTGISGVFVSLKGGFLFSFIDSMILVKLTSYCAGGSNFFVSIKLGSLFSLISIRGGSRLDSIVLRSVF